MKGNSFLYIVYQNFTVYHHGELLTSGTELKTGMSIYINFKIIQSSAVHCNIYFGEISKVHTIGIKTVSNY